MDDFNTKVVEMDKKDGAVIKLTENGLLIEETTIAPKKRC